MLDTRHSVATTILALALALAGPAHAGKLYKWVDDQGKVHYGDKIPPEIAKRERKVLSDQGVVVKTLDRQKTDNELAAEEARRKVLADQARREQEKRAHDHMLLATFSSEDDMILTRDGKLASIDAVIRITRDRIARADEQIRELSRAAADIERSARPVPENMHANIQSLREQVRNYRSYIESQEAEKSTINRQFEADLQRFRELRAASDEDM